MYSLILLVASSFVGNSALVIKNAMFLPNSLSSNLPLNFFADSDIAFDISSPASTALAIYSTACAANSLKSTSPNIDDLTIPPLAD